MFRVYKVEFICKKLASKLEQQKNKTRGKRENKRAANDRHTVLPMREGRRRPERRCRHQQRRRLPCPRVRVRAPTSRLRARSALDDAGLAPSVFVVLALVPTSAERSAIMCASRSSSGDSELMTIILI